MADAAARAFLEDFDGADDDRSDEEEINTNEGDGKEAGDVKVASSDSGAAESASSNDGDEKSTNISRQRLSEIIQMGMSGAAAKGKALDTKNSSESSSRPPPPPVPVFNKNQTDSSRTTSVMMKAGNDVAPPPGFATKAAAATKEQPPPGFEGVTPPPPGFGKRTSSSTSSSSSSSLNPNLAPPPGFDRAGDCQDDTSNPAQSDRIDSSSANTNSFTAVAAENGTSSEDKKENVADFVATSKKRPRENNTKESASSSSSSTSTASVSSSSKRTSKAPKITLRSVSEKDWARVDSLLDLAFSRIKPEQSASRDSFTKSLKTNPLVRAIASDSKMAQRFNKMVEEAIDFEEHLKPHKAMLLDLARL
mmetsp:Transcript_9898/g.13704  ORF Transcript_9898/g.13704 Transcript_9898/m.13704 type:complete len:364 (+) Transcript_9898:171-1262(+)|eukprot:jgi/Bigna1/146786/aug1.121_g21494